MLGGGGEGVWDGPPLGGRTTNSGGVWVCVREGEWEGVWDGLPLGGRTTNRGCVRGGAGVRGCVNILYGIFEQICDTVIRKTRTAIQ